ncbi:MAG: protein kinase [Pseudomonadota bacterium]
MTSDHSKLSADFADQLSDLEQQGSATDAVFLNQAREALEQVLEASGGDEIAVRATLAERRESGELREETYDVVTSMLESYRSEQLETAGNAPSLDDVFGDEQPAFDQTMVIDTRAQPMMARADQQLQVGSVLRDRFLLKKQVTGGSMGVVFQALDRRRAESGETDPFVAIKVLSADLSDDPKALRLLQQEAAKGRCLSHNHIVRFIDLDRDDDLYFIIMEWMDGENLADILDRSVKLDVDTSLKITRQIGDALDYAHDRGIVHADIKPANIMIQPNGDAKLFDFGVARVRQRQGDGTMQYDPGLQGALTPAYSSMQVLTGEEPVAEDDVFSLACLLYRLIAGYRVFGPRNAAEAAEAGMTPQQLPGLSAGQWRALKKALSFSRVTRFSSVGAFLRELNDVDAEVPSQDTVPIDIVVDETGRFTTDLAPKSSKLPMVLTVLAIAAGAAWFLMPYPPQTIDNPFQRQAAVADSALIAPDDTMPPQATPDPADSEPAASAAEMEAGPADDRLDDEVAAADELAPNESDPPVAEAEPELVTESAPALLPEGDVQLSLDAGAITIDLVEDGSPVLIDVLQPVPADFERTVELSEVSFSGNRSPLDSGELLASVRTLSFAPNNVRQQLQVSMTSDPVREADQQSVLEIRDTSGNALATVTINLQDDDQRRFENALPADTVAFASGQASVLEQEAAVQIDVIRFKPSNETLSVAYTVSDVTATADEDYFAPRDSFVFFEAGQRSARILIPLVQDSVVEGNEAFVIELQSGNTLTDSDVYQRVAVFIRDDD